MPSPVPGAGRRVLCSLLQQCMIRTPSSRCRKPGVLLWRVSAGRHRLSSQTASADNALSKRELISNIICSLYLCVCVCFSDCDIHVVHSHCILSWGHYFKSSDLCQLFGECRRKQQEAGFVSGKLWMSRGFVCLFVTRFLSQTSITHGCVWGVLC